MTDIKRQLNRLFESWSGQLPKSCAKLPPSGSDRQYFRLTGENGQTAIGVFNADIPENKAFIGFSRHFFKKGLPVPEIFAASDDMRTYLIQDLGDRPLLDVVLENKGPGKVSPKVMDLYRKAIRQLVNMQTLGGEGLDYSLCFQRDSFDDQSILWDLNAFKYYFLKLSGLPFDEQALEDDFHELTTALTNVKGDYFMFRDFQARNIMLVDDEPYFIDYQAGRKGPLQYDLASLLFQARADLSNEAREDLLNFYIETAKIRIDLDEPEFRKNYYAFVLIRTIQVLSTYGLRGLHEKKAHFLKSIPYALENAAWLFREQQFSFKIPTLKQLLLDLRNHFLTVNADKAGSKKTEGLTIKVFSFSYKNGIPPDDSGHGGGFVFDCRGIHNPGRYEPYKNLTGRDESVITFLKEKSEINVFLDHATFLVQSSVKTYLERGFSSLSIGFGCTGGRHRSVYAADQMAEYLEKHFPVTVNLRHLQREVEGW